MIVTIPIAGAVHINVPDGLTNEEALAAAYEQLDAAETIAAAGHMELECYEHMGLGNTRAYPYEEVEYARTEI